MSFTPQSPPGRPVCEALELYEMGRPTENLQLVRSVGLALFIISIVVWSLSLVGLYLERKSPRFRKVRPFSISCFLSIAQIIYAVGISLNLAVPLPCAVMLFGMLVGVAGFAYTYLIRVMVFAVESNFTQKAAEKDLMISDDESEKQSVFTTTGESDGFMDKLYSLVKVFMLSVGLMEADEVQTIHLARTKKSYATYSIVMFMPSILVATIIIAVIPTYQGCVGCAIFMEVSISLAIIGGTTVMLALRIQYIAWKKNFHDDNGVFQELNQILLGVVPCFVVSGFLLLFDPQQISYRRDFMWEWAIYFTTGLYWWVCVGSQFLASFRERRRLYVALGNRIHNDGVPKSTSNRRWEGSNHQPFHRPDFLQAMDENNTLKEQFEQYAIRQYAVENVHFVFDVRAYKRFFTEKGDSWRRQKARVLYETYIKMNSVMEVNISHETRTVISSQIELVLKGSAPDTRKLQFVFDKAVDDIIVSVLRPIWRTFEVENEQPRAATSNNSGRFAHLSRAAASSGAHSEMTPAHVQNSHDV